MGELKPGWRRVKFGEMVRLNRETCKAPAAEGIERYIGLEHLEPGDLRVRSWGDVSEGTTFTNRVRPGQVLFGKRRAYQRKVAVADFDAVCSGDIYVFESADPGRLLPGLLPFLCQTDAFFDHAVGTSAGSLSPRTNWPSLAGYEFALPPLEEQGRLLAPLKASVAVLDALREGIHAARALYGSYLTHTFMRMAPAPGIDPRIWAPEEWPCLPLEKACELSAPICYGIVQPGDSLAGGVPTATSNNLNVGFESHIHFTAPAIEERYARSRIRAGDILIVVKGFGTGKIGKVPNFFSGNITRDVARLRFANAADAEFFTHLWKSSAFERYWRAVSVGTTRPELSIGKLRGMLVPWPHHETRQAVAKTLTITSEATTAHSDRLQLAQVTHRELLHRVLQQEESRGKA